jgi:hypothetical protein
VVELEREPRPPWTGESPLPDLGVPAARPAAGDEPVREMELCV